MSVREKIADFLKNTVIVGHNVHFDISMLKTHGIDLSSQLIIDTFELSEIFSQDIESLNLGFLAKHYELLTATDIEHRALTDTKLSIRLLMRYLSQIQQLKGSKKLIWNSLSHRDESGMLSLLSEICHTPGTTNPDLGSIFLELLPSRVHDTSSYNTV